MKRRKIDILNFALFYFCAFLLLCCEEDESPLTRCCHDEKRFLRLGICKYPYNKQAALSFTFDDGCSSVFTKIVPLLDSFNLKGTFYIIAGHVELRNEWEQWKTILNDGHEIGNHSLTHAHKLGSIKDNRTLRMEIDSSFNLITARLGKSPFSFGHPFHSTSTIADKIIFEKHYITKISPPGFCKMISLYDLPLCKNELRRALKTREWVVTSAHGIDDEYCYNSLSTEFVTNLFDFVKSRADSIHVDTFENLSKYKIEASNTRLRIEKTKDQYIVTLLTDLSSEVFNVPLTISIDGLTNALSRIQPHNNSQINLLSKKNRIYVTLAPHSSFVITRQ